MRFEEASEGVKIEEDVNMERDSKKKLDQRKRGHCQADAKVR